MSRPFTPRIKRERIPDGSVAVSSGVASIGSSPYYLKNAKFVAKPWERTSSSWKNTKAAIRLCRIEGIITDPVHEGKSMQGMIDLVKKGDFEKGARMLYAPLGGAPTLNAY